MIKAIPSRSGAYIDFLGATADTKPVPATAPSGSKVIPGSRFHEYDGAFRTFEWNPDTGWVLQEGVLDRLPATLGQKTADASLPVVPAATESHLGEVGGKTPSFYGPEMTRPADTNAYTAGDVVSNSTSATTLIPVAIGRKNGGTGFIVKASLVTNQSTCLYRFRVWLYRVSNPTVAADNAPLALLYANRSNRIGYIDLPAMTTQMSGSDSAAAMNDTIRHAFDCAADDSNIYCVLQALDGFTPASGQKFWLELQACQD